MKLQAQIIRNTANRLSKKCSQSNRIFSTNAAVSSTKYAPLATAVSDFLSPTHHEIEDTRFRYTSTQSSMEYPYQPMATAISDYCSPTEVEQVPVDRSSLWSNGLFFATPESDFSSASKVEHERSVEDHLPRWSETLSFASPESDFSSASKVEHERSVEDQLPRWSETLSFASPESDFTSCTDLELLNSVAEVYHQQALLNLRNIIFNNDEFRYSYAYSLSFATPESDFTSNMMTDIMKAQLENVEKASMRFKSRPLHLQNKEIKSSLPKTFDEESLMKSPDAIVVTETAAPFRIVSVNPAWEQLCGFTKEESIGKTLGMLQGPQTDKAAITALLSQMMRGEEAGTELTNYDKSGRKFQNRLTLGPLRSEETNKITHFVGLLKEVHHYEERQAA